MNFEIDASQIRTAADLLRHAKRAVALTGAGISTPSGIPDFRSSDSGLWEQYDPMSVASLLSFRHNPERFFEWSRGLTKTIIDAEPNPAHFSLARLEQADILKAVITQNIDNLHHRAGSQRVYEIHGHLRAATCIQCFRKISTKELILPFVQGEKMPRCEHCGGVLKPDVVLFGEELPIEVVNQARRVMASSDLVLIIGSSLEVTPVALFPLVALDAGAKLIIINEQATYLDHKAEVTFHMDAAIVLPRLVDEVLNG